MRRSIPAILALWMAANAAAVFDVGRAALAQSGCPNEICLSSYECGGQGGTRTKTVLGVTVTFTVPPGSMSLCTQDQYDDSEACNWCDGMQSTRRCLGNSSQTNKCSKPDTPTVCGKPQVGKCTYGTWAGVGTVYYCTGTTAGTQSCNMIAECTGDAPCPAPAPTPPASK